MYKIHLFEAPNPPLWGTKSVILRHKICHYEAQKLPFWGTKFAILRHKICHYEAQNPPFWGTKSAVLRDKIRHYGAPNLLFWGRKSAILWHKICYFVIVLLIRSYTNQMWIHLLGKPCINFWTRGEWNAWHAFKSGDFTRLFRYMTRDLRLIFYSMS